MINELRGVEYVTQEMLNEMGFQKIDVPDLDEGMEMFKKGYSRCLVERCGDGCSKYKIVHICRADET